MCSTSTSGSSDSESTTLISPGNIQKSRYIESAISISVWKSINFNKPRKNAFYNLFPKCIPFVPERYILAILTMLGLSVAYGLRVNLSVALVDMVNHTIITSNGTKYKGDYNWTDDEQGWVLAAFFYGYIFTQIPGGILSNKIGAKWVFGLGVLCTTLLTIITPVVSGISVWVLVVVRILEGLGEGVTFPALLTLWGVWAPPKERSRLCAISYAGQYLGNILSFSLAGVISQQLNWRYVFYITGSCGLVWFVLWVLYAFSSPDSNPRISNEEKKYIVDSLAREISSKKAAIPWFSILTSAPVWAISIAYFCNNWGFYTMLTCMPTFLENTLQLSIQNNGVLSAIPYLAFFIVGLLSGVIADYLRAKWISTGLTRKIFTGLGLLGAAIFLLLCGYYGNTEVMSIIFLTLGVGCQGLVVAGHNVNHLDIAPKYSGIIMGITNTFGTIPGFLGPQLAKYLAKKPPAIFKPGDVTYVEIYKREWINVFWVSAEIYIFGLIAYCILASGEVQKWSTDDKTKIKLNSDKNSLN